MAKTRIDQDTILSAIPAGNHHLTVGEPISVEELLRAIRRLPADKPFDNPRKRYRTQKEHWIGWLGD